MNNPAGSPMTEKGQVPDDVEEGQRRLEGGRRHRRSGRADAAAVAAGRDAGRRREVDGCAAIPAEGREARGPGRRSEQARGVHDPPADARRLQDRAAHASDRRTRDGVVGRAARRDGQRRGTTRRSATSRAGSYANMAATMSHYAQAKGATVVQVHGVGPFVVNYVNPADDPSKK